MDSCSAPRVRPRSSRTFHGRVDWPEALTCVSLVVPPIYRLYFRRLFMQNIRLKLKQASAVLGVSPKDLQNLVQFGVVRPSRRNRVYWFDTGLLLQAKVAFYLKESLGSSSDLLSRFTATLSQDLTRSKLSELKDVSLRSRPASGKDAVEIKIPASFARNGVGKAVAPRQRQPGPSSRPQKAGMEKGLFSQPGGRCC